MGRPQTSLNAQELLAKGSGGVGSDLCAFHPPSFAISFNGLIGGVRMTREEVCRDEKEASQKSGASSTYSQ